jgi:glycosyltransferase involved in cell wall biosynthesis
VAIVSSSHELGGAEVYLLTVIDGLAPRADLRLLAGDRSAVALRDHARAAGVPVTVVTGLARRPSPPAALRLARALRRLRPDLVHVNLTDQGDGVVGIAAARLARLPVTATLHIVLPERRPVLERLAGLVLRRARGVIAVSDDVGRYLDEQGVRRSVVHNGVAPIAATPDARARLGLAATDFVVGGVGRLNVQKGWDVLCAAAPRVREQRPDARFVIVGDGPERERLAAGAGAEAVRFAGYHERASGLMPAFDVLAVPSRYEGFGLVVVEAMLAGVPVVAARAGALPEVVGDAGVLVAPDDPDALAEALVRVASNPRLRSDLARRGRERARSRFGWERMADETLAFWRGMI